MGTSLQKIDVVFLNVLCKFLLGGEPVFIMRAQDKLTMDRVRDYQKAAIAVGATNTGRVQTSIDNITEWQKNNPDKMKFPD